MQYGPLKQHRWFGVALGTVTGMDPSGARIGAGHCSAGPTEEGLAGRYRLSSLIGTGGMGTVWRAEDGVLGRVVAADLTALGLRPSESYLTSESTSGQVLTIGPQGRVPVGSVVQVGVAAPPPPLPAPPAPKQPGPPGHGGSDSGSGRHHPKSGD